MSATLAGWALLALGALDQGFTLGERFIALGQQLRRGQEVSDEELERAAAEGHALTDEVNRRNEAKKAQAGEDTDGA